MPAAPLTLPGTPAPPPQPLPAGPLAAWQFGERGPLVVAVHGLAESSRYWSGSLAAMAAGHRVVVVDLLGFGRSPWPDIGYTAEAQADAVAATLAGAGLDGEPAVVVGHQAGATVAVALARRHPEAVAAVVGLGTPWFRSPAEARRALRGPWWMSRWLVDHTDRARLLCRTLCGRRRTLVPRVARWFVPGSVPDQVVEDAFLHTWTSFSETLRTCLVEADLPGAVGPELRTPLVALHGVEDTLVPIENLLDARAARPLLRVERLAGLGHNLAWEAPEAVAAVVAELSARPLRSGPARPPRLDARPAAASPRRRGPDRSIPALVAPAEEHGVGEAARLARVSRRTVLGWVQSGRVNARRDGGRLLVDRGSLLDHAFGPDPAARQLLAAAWLTAAEAAARLGVGHATLARMGARGLPSHRIGGRRIYIAAEIDAWAAEQPPG